MGKDEANAPQTTHEDDIAPYTPTVPRHHIDKDEEVSLFFDSGALSIYSTNWPQTAAYAGEAATFVDEKTNKELFWTVNRRILACMLGTYFCQSLDKGTLGFASIMGIRQDAHLVGQQFRLVLSVLRYINHESID